MKYTPSTVTSPQDPTWMGEELHAIWGRQDEVVNDRIDAIEGAIGALLDSRLDPTTRRDGERAAHMLAGSCGMFGFAAASRAARLIELGLEHPKPEDVSTLSALLQSVREDLKVDATSVPR